ncbi:MAG: flagellin [Bacillota bacterium]
MRINNNISALNTFRQYTANTNSANKSMEKLSSGLRINRAGDDAAGLAISEKMRAQIRGIEMASKNSQDAISLVQTAEGALTETHAILQRMNELAVQSSSDTNETIDRDALQAEFDQLKSEINDIADQTKFNNKKLLNGSLNQAGTTIDIATSTLKAGSDGVIGMQAEGPAGCIYEFADDGSALTVTRKSDGTNADAVFTLASPAAGAQTINVEELGLTIQLGVDYAAKGLNGKNIVMEADPSAQGLVIQTGANNGETLSVSISAMDSTTLGISGANISTQIGASNAIETITDAINTVSGERAKLGAIQNRLEHKINNLNTSSENLQAAESRIRDVDMAQEMVEFTKNNILLQAAQSMLAQANAQPQGVLQLLK